MAVTPADPPQGPPAAAGKMTAYPSTTMAAPHFEKHVFICVNRRAPGNPKGDCASKGGEEVREAFKRLLHEKGLKGRIRANAAGCLDQCARGVHRGGLSRTGLVRRRAASRTCPRSSSST